MAIETTPREISPMLNVLCHDLNPTVSPLWVKVVPESWAAQNECFPNVQKKIMLNGGTFVNGWAIWQWANMLITAEAHSIWKNDAGELVDITPHNYNEHTILFVPDSAITYEGVVIPSKRAPMTNSPKIAYLIDLLNTRDYMLQQSGTKKMCAFPEPFLNEIQRVLTDIKQEVGRNDPCPCGSGIKYKKCCGRYETI